VVDAEAVGIESCSVRKAGVELCRACWFTVGIEQFRAVWDGKCIQVRLHRGQRRGTLPSIQVGDGGFCYLRQPQAKSLVGKEKERSILQNGAAQRAPEIILAFFRFWQAVVVR